MDDLTSEDITSSSVPTAEQDYYAILGMFCLEDRIHTSADDQKETLQGYVLFLV